MSPTFQGKFHQVVKHDHGLLQCRVGGRDAREGVTFQEEAQEWEKNLTGVCTDILVPTTSRS